MKQDKKGDTVCLIDYPRSGNIEEVIVASSGRKYITVMRYPYLKFDADTLYNNCPGGGKIFIGSKAKYDVWKHEQAKRREMIEEITSKVHLLSKIQLQDIKYQINKMIE